MTSIFMKRRATQAAMSLAIVAPMLALFATPITASKITSKTEGSSSFGDPAFERVWSRTDKPVQDKAVNRSWTWGPEPFYTTYETYAEGPGEKHLVTYFDKSRMEINNPAGDRNSEWFVTNGLLVVEMMSGKIQTGNNTFAQAAPANMPVAGDAATSLNAPTYASLARVASLQGDGRAPSRTGQNIREGLGRSGGVGTVDNLAGYARYGVYEPTLGHNIPDVFWSFLNQKGLTYKNGKYLPEEDVIDWIFAMGYPITEPYWIEIKAAGQTRWVLMQAFQRRILTYSPDNPAGWKVEMGNVGRAYFEWRYNRVGVQPMPPAIPLPTATPLPKASIALDPSEGNGTNITVSGKYFPAHVAVTIGAEKAPAGYSRGITTVAAKSDGTFSVEVDMPADANRFGDLVVTASANGGAVKAAQTYRFNYDARVTVTPREVVTNGSVRVQGQGFSANASIRLGMFMPDNSMDWRATVRANADGKFDSAMPVGDRPAGTLFRVVATADGGYKATSQEAVTVIAQPSVRVSPNSGPAGVHVNLRGFNWPAKRAIYVTLRAANSQNDALLPNPIMSDANGSFSIPVWIGQEYARAGEVRLIASEAVSKVNLEGSYFVTAPPTPTALPANPTLAVNPQVLAVGQPATIAGSRWPAGATISLGLGRNVETGVEEWVASARADRAGNFTVNFVVSSRWRNAGQLTLFGAAPNGLVATTPVWVASTGGRITPMGLPMNISTYWGKDGQQYVKVKAAGWPRDKAVQVSVISADGTVNAAVANATVKPEGTFSTTFNPAAPWWGRADLGVKAVTNDGQQYSLRYLPKTDMSKVNGNTYSVSGANWPANAHLVVVLHLDEGGDRNVASATTDANGTVTLTFTLPGGVKIPPTNSNDFEVKAVDELYTATFDF